MLKSMVGCGLTPELSRAALRPWASETLWYLHEAAKRSRLERIVRPHLRSRNCGCDEHIRSKPYAEKPGCPLDRDHVGSGRSKESFEKPSVRLNGLASEDDCNEPNNDEKSSKNSNHLN